MRMAELSRESGVPVATIKYYLREGLLHPGERTSPNQAHYNDTHVQRLRLVRALLDVGSLSVATAKEVLVALDSSEMSLHHVLGVTQYGLPLANTEQADEEAREWARATAERLLDERGWVYEEDSPAVDSLIGVLATMYTLGYADLASVLDRYADSAENIAEADVRYIAGLPSTESIVEGMVVGTLFGDALLVALRRLAQASVSATVFGSDGEGEEISPRGSA
ncbi:MerR family transcriptional regulator [Saccharomonospora sp.]|uniref:MerR family transcriptional regulator n=1 Tax=Saccharomonospora sp. TaxID=33913 RepID=UPI0026186F20|nr:MerR family transcriptional regulator [Saccharomonospora sp.]